MDELEFNSNFFFIELEISLFCIDWHQENRKRWKEKCRKKLHKHMCIKYLFRWLLSVLKVYDFMNFRLSREFIWRRSSYVLATYSLFCSFRVGEYCVCMYVCVCRSTLLVFLHNQVQANSTWIPSTTSYLW